MLDWENPALSPLRLSAGWQTGAGEVSENGLALSDNFDVAFYIKGDQKPVVLYDAELLLSYEAVSTFGSDVEITNTSNSDVLVGTGGNTFFGAEGDDLFVLSYGATNNTTSTIADFTPGEELLGLINLGVTASNFADSIIQTLSADGLGLSISANGSALATLTRVTTELGADSFYLA